MNWLVAIAVIAVAAAAFVFSYDGVHAVALLGGVSAQLARYYPALFDALLVIACVAAVVLRDGRWWARLWAWAVIIVLLAAIGITDVLHAMNYTLRHRPTEGIVAAAPVAAVLLAFSLLLTLLRQSRTPAEAPPAAGEVPALPAAISGPPIALPAGQSPGDEAMPGYSGDPLGEAIPGEPPTADQSAPPTVLIPALPSAPPPGPAPTRGAPGGIRYAGAGVPGMAGKQPPAASRDDAPSKDDEWDREENGPLAGLVYPARDEHAADAGEASEVDDAQTDPPATTTPEPDDDAPPFATAPFTSMPRLNRVRSAPTPPESDDE